MSDVLSPEAILSQAVEQAKQYDWIGAVESYTRVLDLVSVQDFSRMGDILERLGYALYRAAFQAEGNEEFKERMSQAGVTYEKAKELCGKLNDSAETTRMLRHDAMIAYIDYWLASEAPEKKRLLSKGWRFAADSLKALKESGKAQEYGKTYNQLSAIALLGFCLEWDYQARKKIIREVADHGEVGIKLLSTADEPDELAKVCAETAFSLSLFAYYFLDLDEKENCVRKAQSYWTKAKEASEDSARLEMLCPIPCAHDLLWGYGSQEAFANLERALEHCRRTRDKFLVGSALDWLTYHTVWTINRVDDYDEVAKVAKRAIQYAEDAKRQYSVISFISPRAENAWIEAIHAQLMPGYGRETDLGKKRGMLERAIGAGRDASKPAEASGYPYTIQFIHGQLSAKLRMLAEIESSPEEKKELLEEALQHGRECLRIAEHLDPLAYWDLGAYRGNLAVIKCELADLAKDSETRKSILHAAILERESALKLLVKDLSHQPQKKIASFVVLGNTQYSAGSWWSRLYRLTSDREHLKKATEVFAEAVESYQKVNRTSRIAECHWKIAQAHDELGDHLRAAENFCLASDNFKGAAEKIPQLKSFYEDHAIYMQAWGEIEKARHHHERQEYGSAREHFEKATNLHGASKRWSYMAPNYSAWVQLENAEELSRKEKSEEAIQAFEQAGNFFGQTKKSLQVQLDKIESIDEKQMATSMVEASDLRHKYCTARIVLEEARILDKKGDHYSSSEKYGSAAEKFEKIGRTLELEQEQREMKFITTLSRAWEKMTLAEAKSSPPLYSEASQLFQQTEDLSPNEKTKMLVLGHSRFCRALEAGTEFADTRDVKMHGVATKYLESAANYYLRADFQKASDYAKGTKLLLEAYIHMDNAESEKDPEKKTRHYVVAEKVLRMSAGAYAKAEHPEKTQQVTRLLEKVEEERELAVSIDEVLHAPSMISATTALATPTPTREEAVGLERFEHADIQANMFASHKELRVGENLELEIEFVNAGKASAQLMEVTEIIPEGFDITEKPETCRVEDSFVNMKGKRLDPLKTEELKLVLKPRVQGIFPIKPTILYLDENGKRKSHEPEPITIRVRELGIKGWLKG
jgi:hypothetical protein